MPQGPGTYGSKRGRPPKKASAFTMKYKNSAFPFKSPLRQNADTRTWDPEIDKGREGVYLEMRPSHQWLGGARQVMKGKRGSGGTGSYNPEGLPLNKYGGTDLSI